MVVSYSKVRAGFKNSPKGLRFRVSTETEFQLERKSIKHKKRRKKRGKEIINGGRVTIFFSKKMSFVFRFVDVEFIYPHQHQQCRNFLHFGTEIRYIKAESSASHRCKAFI